MARRLQVNRVSKRRTKVKFRGKKKDPIFVGGQRPKPMTWTTRIWNFSKKLTNRQGKIISRRKSGCTAVSQHAVTRGHQAGTLHGLVAVRRRIDSRRASFRPPQRRASALIMPVLRSHSSHRWGQAATGLLEGRMPKPWPPEA